MVSTFHLSLAHTSQMFFPSTLLKGHQWLHPCCQIQRALLCSLSSIQCSYPLPSLEILSFLGFCITKPSRETHSRVYIMLSKAGQREMEFKKCPWASSQVTTRCGNRAQQDHDSQKPSPSHSHTLQVCPCQHNKGTLGPRVLGVGKLEAG